MKLQPYWLDSAPVFGGGSAGPVEGRVDVVVVGAGFTGLSAALALARTGASVVVLDADRVVGQASGRNGGHCNTGTAQDFGALTAQFGLARARAFYRSFVQAVDTVETVIADEGIDCDFVRPGKLKLAAKPEHFAKLARAYEILVKEVDQDVALVAPSRIRDEVGSDRYHGGLLSTRGAQMHMGRFGVGLAEAAARHGARIYEHAAVTGLKRLHGNAYEVTSARGTVRADKVLVATGSSQSGPFTFFERRMAPVGSFVLATAPIDPPVLDALLPKRRSYVTTKNIGNYFRTTPDNRLIFGGRARFAMSNPKSDAKSGRILRETLGQAFPELRDVAIDYCWGGLIDVTVDRLPRAGVHDGLYYSMGYSGHGTHMATHMGQVMAAMMSGTARDPAETAPWLDLPWREVPLQSGRKYFLPVIGAYYRLQDILH